MEQNAQGSGGIAICGCSKYMWIWHMGIWFSAECGGAGLIVELDDLKGLSQS